MNSKDVVLLETHYLPNIEYFAVIARSSEVIIHGDENFQKQSYRNRCYVLGPNKVQLLSVPVTGKTRRSSIRDVTINYDENWYLQHVSTLQTAYGKAPFFEYYFEYFKDVLMKKHRFLLELNQQMLTLCLDLLKIDTKISDSKNSQLNLTKIDNRYYELISRKTPHLDRGIYQEANYQQLFGSKFVPNLSIIDLLFCEGPNSGTIIGQSTIKHI